MFIYENDSLRNFIQFIWSNVQIRIGKSCCAVKTLTNIRKVKAS